MASSLLCLSLFPVYLFPGWAALLPFAPMVPLHTCDSSPHNHLHLPPVFETSTLPWVGAAWLKGPRTLCLFSVCSSHPARLAEPVLTSLWTFSIL